MTGKTHIAVGAAAALAVAKYVPAALTAGVPAIAGDASTLACLAAGAAGGLLVAVIAATFAADALLGLDLGTQTVAFARTAGVYQVAGAAVVVAVLACGRASGHRGFSHSLVAAALFFAGVYLAVPEIALALTVGYCSHLVIDLFNKMPERLFWPVARGQSFGLCKSGGVVDGALLVLAVVAVVALLAGWL